MENLYRFVTFEELEAKLDKTLPIMFDTETIGFYGKIRLAQFYQRHFECAYLIENPDPYKLVALLTRLKPVMHNAHYDITTVQEQLGKLTWMPDEFHCTFLLGRLHFYKEDGFSLDNIVQYTLGSDPYNGTKKENQGSDWNVPVLSESQLIYASRDVIYLHDVWDTVKEKLDDINYKLDLLMTRYCLDFQNNGLPVDLEKLNAQYVKNMEEIKRIGLPINCKSYVQVRQYINSNMSDDLGLATQAIQGNEKAQQVRETRWLATENSYLIKFQTTMKEYADGFGLIFGKFKLSARSGRTTSNDQNLQQLPRSLKGIFGVPEDGDEVILFSDFAQIQLRGVCVVTGDSTMERLFREGADLHNFVAEMIFGKDFTKTHRQISKTANFGLLFGAGIIVFISILLKEADLWLKEQEAMTIKKKWLSLWKQIGDWQNRGIKSWKKGEAWETPLGRRYTAKMMTDQLAMQIQGFEAEVAKLATHYMIPKLKELNPDIKLRNFVHDSFIFTAPNDPEIYKPACVIIAEAMQEAWREMCQSVIITDLPMPTKVRVGWNWGDIEKDEYIYELSI